MIKFDEFASLPAERPRPHKAGSRQRESLILGPDPRKVRGARLWVNSKARSTPARADDVELVASELVTNALCHSRSGDPGGRVLIELETHKDGYLLRVTDDGPRPGEEHIYPRQYTTDPDEGNAGRGLRLVSALSRWHWTMNANGTVTVQALIPREGRR